MPALEMKPLPVDLSFKSLFDPNTSYTYFKDALSQPFRFDATSYDSVNAWWLAEASMLAYVQDHGFVSRQLKEAGLSGCYFPENSNTGTQSFIAHNDDFAIVCFRGTEMDKKDILTDLGLGMVDSGHGGQVHQGFKKAIDSVWPEITQRLDTITNHGNNNLKVWFTGHSLGAALATLAAARYSCMQGLYTIASPRTGDQQFISSFRSDNFWRFVHNNDIVTMIPPKFHYRHGGKLVFIDELGNIHHQPGFLTRLKSWIKGHGKHIGVILKHWKSGDFSVIPLDSLNDHAPIYYVVRIWNKHIKDIQKKPA